MEQSINWYANVITFTPNTTTNYQRLNLQILIITQTKQIPYTLYNCLW